ncbi:DinB family protein [Nocardioides sp. SR21]|uniref:DinB family protein n=1 Tax=Nocardioides sp. SR21 TaxID=2919501 RepID=UPI001FA9D060|nr:DinB family protein [Nocardioides sp. SR21]
MTNTERDDLIDLLTKHRELFRFTVQGLSDDAARTTPTASELSLGGLIKHVTAMEKSWADFIVNGPAERPDVDWASVDWSNPPAEVLEFQNGFRMLEHETLEGLLKDHSDAAAVTDELVRTVDLDSRHPLPEAPWFPAGATWSARRALIHIALETAQHAGHADIIRETIDGQKSMG